ncbi:hypothetical protein PAT3040_05491, partial [Paenibacillus agaridevorans]
DQRVQTLSPLGRETSPVSFGMKAIANPKAHERTKNLPQ